MKAFATIRLILIMVPPLGLLFYGVWVGYIDSALEILSNLVRYILVAISATIISVAMATKMKLSDSPDLALGFGLYLMYIFMFFFLNFAFGVEVMNSGADEPIYRP